MPKRQRGTPCEQEKTIRDFSRNENVNSRINEKAPRKARFARGAMSWPAETLPDLGSPNLASTCRAKRCLSRPHPAMPRWTLLQNTSRWTSPPGSSRVIPCPTRTCPAIPKLTEPNHDATRLARPHRTMSCPVSFAPNQMPPDRGNDSVLNCLRNHAAVPKVGAGDVAKPTKASKSLQCVCA